MGRKGRKNKARTKKGVCNGISEERLTEIYAESFYRAIKRLDEEKENVQEQIPKPKKGRLLCICMDLLLVLNLVFFPFKISKRFKLNKRIYDGVLIVIISVGLECFGALMWFAGIYRFICDFTHVFDAGISITLFGAFVIDLMFSFFGSFFYLAGKTFGEETESNKVYAYSASILALVSCIVSLVALLRR